MKTKTEKHTPGPWIMEDFGEVRMKGISGFRALEGSNGEPITRLVRDNSPEGLANAALIAAAPEMLAACVAALPLLEEYRQRVFTGRIRGDLLSGDYEPTQALRAAIAKAEGRAI